jgi:2-methylcitrate dehydratase PrpD
LAKNSAEQFIDYAAGFAFADLSPDLQELSKLILLDTIGVGVAASTIGVGCNEAVAYARAWLGRGGSAIWGYGEPSSPLGAAFANGALAHALNFDGLGAGYVGLVTPAVLAAADCVEDVSGAELLAGHAIGAELATRIHRAVAHAEHGLVLDGQLQSYFGCAIGAAKVMRLTPAAMHHALGLALMQAAGSVQIVLDGDPPAKAIYGAFPNQGGLQASLLACQGLGAACDAFDGNAGLFRLHYAQADSSTFLSGLGTEFLFAKARLKPWPTSAALFPLIEAAIKLAHEHRIVASEIESVRISAHPGLRMWFEPEAVRRHPPNAAAAANSAFFTVAKALVKGRLTLEDFTISGLADSTATALAHMIELHPAGASAEGTSLTVAMRSGARWQQPFVVGGGGLPTAPRIEIENKFRQCMLYAADRRLQDRTEQLLSLILRLETVSDCRELRQLLT